jgi:MFS family permease
MPDITLKRVLTTGSVMRVLYGFTLGLYLFIYVLTFEQLFGVEADGRFLLGAVFVFDFVMEAVLDVPLGAYADIRGYKPTLLRSFVFRAFFFMGLMLTVLLLNHHSTGYPVAFFTQGLFAVAYTLWSGANSAWLYDSLAQLGSESSYLKYFSRMQTGYYVGYIGGAILSAYLYFAKQSMVAYGLGAICSLIGAFFIKVYLVEPTIKKEQIKRKAWSTYRKQIVDIIADAWRYCLSSKEIYYLLQLAGFFALLMHAVNYLWPPYAKDLLQITKPLDWRWISVVLVMTLGSLMGNALIGMRWKKNQDTEQSEWRHYLLISFCFGLPMLCLSILAMSGFNNFVPFVILIALARVAVGAKDAPYEALMNRLITRVSQNPRSSRPSSEVRATILSSASIFNAVLILFFFVPTTVLGAKNTVKGWLFPASLLVVATVLTRRRGNGRSNKRVGVGV